MALAWLDEVQAHLHNLLIYGPGQFFKPHQDTEKRGMVATLVLVWPSAHIGGALRVWCMVPTRAGCESHHLQVDSLRWCAFMPTVSTRCCRCRRAGAVLSFDLVVPARMRHGEAAAAGPGAGAARAMLSEGESPAPSPWVFLLDHEYTEHGLRWQLLKGLDRARVAALRQCGAAAGLVMHLALARSTANPGRFEGYMGIRYRAGAGPVRRAACLGPRQSPVFVQACEAAGTQGRCHDSPPRCSTSCWRNAWPCASHATASRPPRALTPAERNSAWRWRAQHGRIGLAGAGPRQRPPTPGRGWLVMCTRMPACHPPAAAAPAAAGLPPQAADLPTCKATRRVLQALAQAPAPQPPADDHACKALNGPAAAKRLPGRYRLGRGPDGHSLTLPMVEPAAAMCRKC